MRVPQELINAIVSYVDHGDDLEILLNLLRASSQSTTTSVHLQAPATYAQLWAMVALSPNVLSTIHHLRITGQMSDIAQPEKLHLPAILDGCSSLRILHIDQCYEHWTYEFSGLEQRALYRAMQRPGLVALRLETSISVLPPSLKAMALSRVRQVDRPLAEFIGLDVGSSMATLEELRSDEMSLPFVRMMLKCAHPFRKLRRLLLTSGIYNAPDVRATPHLDYLFLRHESYQWPMYNLSHHTALRALHIQGPLVPTGFDSFGHVAAALRSLPAENPLEQFTLTIACSLREVDQMTEYWRELDELLSSEEHFAHLREVCIILRVREWLDGCVGPRLMTLMYGLTIMELVPKTSARRILRVYDGLWLRGPSDSLVLPPADQVVSP
ncbi:hypothetical protein BD626DRAFT_507818 [Schizophyllum amplum]|uniref:F-box domain-containing protein n=1 Tax=Schizophyllum amplum TaxID=97359 RepID=A0A550C4B3_9AGAR|nr:hypothetical protein BD626DRAFT_507818 [Auriculariopsis ampla]